MKKTFFKLFIIALFLVIIAACYDPIFDIISKEIAIVPPFIEGSPSNFAVFENVLYVASGMDLFSYDGTWKSASSHDGYIMYLAASAQYLYAVIAVDSSGVLRRTDFTDGWTTVMSNKNVQSVFYENNQLFICAMNSDGTFNIFSADDASLTTAPPESPIPGAENISFLRGVAYSGGSYYFSAGSIYTGSSASVTAVPGGSDFYGIINLGSIMAAISRNGTLYTVTADSVTSTEKNIGNKASGAMTVFYDGSDKLLLVGRHDTNYSQQASYTNGYMEIDFNDSGFGSFREPGNFPFTTVNKNSTYVNSIGTNPVNHIIQTPASVNSVNSERMLFASTHRNGVWRLYKDEDGNDQWNAVPQP